MKRVFLEITAGEGPEECRFFAARLARRVEKELTAAGAALQVVALHGDREGDSLRSILFELEGENLAALTAPWLGSHLWISPSPFRPECRRKNWFAGIRRFERDPELSFQPGEVEITASRSSGPGGQHVNTTNTRIQAVHRPTGIRAEASEERSQARNRSLALARLALKLAEANTITASNLRGEAWKAHHALERGNPVRTFRGRELFDELKYER